MNPRATLSAAVFLAAFASGAMPLQAQPELPIDQALIFRIHDTPSDRYSAKHLEIRMELVAVDRLDDEVAWRVKSIQVTRFDGAGAIVSEWVDTQPVIQTQSTLWHVIHVDPLDPALEEFTEPPLIFGFAACTEPNDPELHYEFQGVTLGGSTQPGVYDVTSYWDYYFELAGVAVPIDEGDGEPVESDEEDDNPSYS
jgi:hypothetical protein